MESFIQSSWTKKPDETFEVTLRPFQLTEFLGQERLKERLEIFIGAAKKRKEALGHCLFYGPPGLGKTTLSNILAKEMGAQLTTSSGPALEKAADLAGILTNLKEGDFLFIDEIHCLPRNIEEYLYSAMENFSLDLMIDSGPAARSVQIKLAPFTLVGATTRFGLLSSPMRSRFSFTYRLDYYEPQVLKQIVLRSSQILKVPIDELGALEIARRARGTPRIANHLLRWVRDFVETQGLKSIDKAAANKALLMLDIDEKGLDEMDKRILRLIIQHHQGGPVGLTTLAVALGEDPLTLSEVYEPYLIMQGFLKRTPRGREVTKFAYEHLKLNNGDILC
ncbi:MAG TPA: Holliday junction branch migration DNA helicase RuvB [Rhabdochlamydiaceae bacterium]|nr:Holliday junction branch migration DNA helicase RuvB [Rhabdochlamydiaceae bacterium]